MEVLAFDLGIIELFTYNLPATRVLAVLSGPHRDISNWHCALAQGGEASHTGDSVHDCA